MKRQAVIDSTAKDQQFLKNIARRRGEGYVDKRTHRETDKGLCVCPAATNETQVFVCCPYCGEFHAHGRGGDGRVYGGRVSHCTNGRQGEYYILDPQESREGAQDV